MQIQASSSMKLNKRKTKQLTVSNWFVTTKQGRWAMIKIYQNLLKKEVEKSQRYKELLDMEISANNNKIKMRIQ